jgi:hypothetical protein
VEACNNGISSDVDASMDAVTEAENLQPLNYYRLTTNNGSDKYQRAYNGLAKAYALEDKNSQYYSDTRQYFNNYVLDKRIDPGSEDASEMWANYIKNKLEMARELKKVLLPNEQRALDEELGKLFPEN